MLVALLALQAVAPVLVSGEVAGAKEPQAATTADGKFVVVFGKGDGIYATHETAPGTWGKPTQIGVVEGMPLGMRRGPRIAISKDVWLITVPSLSRMKGDLLAFYSTDAGKTWTGPSQVNDTAACAPEGLQSVAVNDEGNFVAIWLDGREGKTVLYTSEWMKTNHRWNPNLPLYRSPSGSICECCHPTVATGPSGTYVLFRNSIDGNRDMFGGRLDEGELVNYGKLGQGTWKLDACPMDGGALAFTPAGNKVAVWRREGTIYSSSLERNTKETKVGEGEQPTVTGNTGSIWIAWLEKRMGGLLATRAGSGKVQKLAESADDPVLASTDKRVLAVWADKDGVKAKELK